MCGGRSKEYGNQVLGRGPRESVVHPMGPERPRYATGLVPSLALGELSVLLIIHVSIKRGALWHLFQNERIKNCN